MIPILFDKNETTFISNGIGRLSDCIFANVTEERNGIYELEMQYPTSGRLFDKIQLQCYIGVTHDDRGDVQAFQIYKVEKPINGICTFYGQHISYQLSKTVVKPFVSTSCVDTMNKLKSKSMNTHSFTFHTDIDSQAHVEVMVPSSVRSVLGGSEGSLLDVYGGEYEYDMFNVNLWEQRGQDTGTVIRYGKNLTNFEIEADNSESYTAIAPYWYSESNGISRVYLTEGYLIAKNSPTIFGKLVIEDDNYLITDDGNIFLLDYYELSIKPLDISNEFDEKPSEDELRQKGMEIIENAHPWEPTGNITIDFVQLGQTKEYKHLEPFERIRLCDTISVYYPEMNVFIDSMKVIRTVWDVLLDRFVEIELGNSKETLVDVITESVEADLNK